MTTRTVLAPRSADETDADRARHRDPSDRRAFLRLLLLLQGALAVLTAIEAAIIGLGFGAPFPSGGALLTALAAAWWLGWAARVGEASPTALRWLVRSEVLVIAGSAVDLALSVWFAGRLLEPVAIATQVVLPAVVIRLARAERRDPSSVGLPTSEEVHG